MNGGMRVAAEARSSDPVRSRDFGALPQSPFRRGRDLSWRRIVVDPSLDVQSMRFRYSGL